MTNAKMALAATVTCHFGDTGRLFCRCRFLRSNFQRSAASLFSCPAASQRKSFVTLPQRSHRRTLITTFHCGKKKQLKCAARRLVDYIFTFRNFLVLFIFEEKKLRLFRQRTTPTRIRQFFRWFLWHQLLVPLFTTFNKKEKIITHKKKAFVTCRC